LSGVADVPVRGRSKADFRPGLRLADFIVSYRVDRPASEMTVSGQIQQMRLSRCYQESKAMSCATCHDPHAVPDAAERVDYFRNKCLTCHQTDSCKQKQAARKEKQDNCVICHMPQSSTDIPHFSFTHHRMAVHPPQPQFAKLTDADKLIAVGDVSHLPEHERLRQMGLANDIFSGKLAGGLNDESRDDPSYQALANVFVNRGRQILEGLQARGLRDPDIETFVSRMNWRKSPEQSIAHAEAALNLKSISPATRGTALYYLASSLFDQRQFEQAFPNLERLVHMERSEISLMLLAICHQNKGELPEAVGLMKQAIQDAPDRADLHLYLATVYRKLGNPAEADSHERLAKLLQQKVPQPQ
jgi:Flp pilus assembly protein TadD